MDKANKVMIIDDEQTFIVPLEIGLKRKGIEVVSFTKPLEAIEYLKNNKVDVLLTDYHMEPEINGDEVIKRVREFNKEIIIYLQTGFAEDLPAEEMLEKYDIQGYINKGEGQDKNMQLIKSSLKQASLIEMVKEQEKQINALQYRDEFFGKFLYRVVGEARERFLVVSGLLNSVTNEEERNKLSKEEIERYTGHIQEAMSKFMDCINSLEIEKISILSSTQLVEILNSLFEIHLKTVNAKLNFECNEYMTFDCDPKTLIYILVDVIEKLLNANENEINIVLENKEKKFIKVCNKVNNKELVEKISKLAKFDDKIDVIEENEQINIHIG